VKAQEAKAVNFDLLPVSIVRTEIYAVIRSDEPDFFKHFSDACRIELPKYSVY
jgi:hypothetical protein